MNLFIIKLNKIMEFNYNSDHHTNELFCKVNLRKDYDTELLFGLNEYFVKRKIPQDHYGIYIKGDSLYVVYHSPTGSYELTRNIMKNSSKFFKILSKVSSIQNFNESRLTIKFKKLLKDLDCEMVFQIYGALNVANEKLRIDKERSPKLKEFTYLLEHRHVADFREYFFHFLKK